ncbi:MAG: 50S ribosomal protein L35 [bacterium]
MPKMKTRKAAAKRFKITGKGKVMYKKANKGHLLTRKNSKRKRNLRKEGKVSNADVKRIKNMMPYGS